MDILVRIVAEGLQRVRGVSVIPEIRSGAYGFIAAQAAARAAPDGYNAGECYHGDDKHSTRYPWHSHSA